MQVPLSGVAKSSIGWLAADSGRNQTKDLVVAFFISRISFLGAKVYMRFDPSMMHLVEPSVLGSEFWKSLLYMPGQPPGFQLLVSALDAISFGWITLPAFFLYLGLGLCLMLALYRTMVLLKVPSNLAAVVAFAFSISSNVILHERCLHYTYPIMVCLAVGLLAFVRLSADFSLSTLRTAYLMFAIPSWLHSFFNPVFVAAVVAAHAIAIPDKGRRIFRAALPALAIAFAPTIKNGVLYDYWVSSTWGPFSLAQVASYWSVDAADRAELGALGIPTPLTQRPPFTTPLTDYGLALESSTGHAVLDKLVKDSGANNWMALSAIPVGTALMKETLLVIKRKPELYVRGVQGALYFYLQAPSAFFWERNRERIRYYDAIWQFISAGTLRWHSIPTYVEFRRDFDPAKNPMPKTFFAWGTKYGWGSFPFLSLISFQLLTGWTALQAWHARRARKTVVLVWTSMFIILGYVTSLSLLLELGENMRFRSYVSPVLVIAFGHWLSTFIKRIAAGRDQKGPLG